MSYERVIPLDESNRASRRARRQETTHDIQTKAMPTIGKGPGLIEQATFDPNAEDGDGDGLVQDSTPFERPAILKPITDAVRGMASATGDRQSWHTRTVGKTNREVAEMAYPRSREDAELMIRVNSATLGIGDLEYIEDTLGEATFDEELIDLAVDELEKALDKNPKMRELIDTVGLPTYIVTADPGTTFAGQFTPDLLVVTMTEKGLKRKKGRLESALGRMVPFLQDLNVGMTKPKKKVPWSLSSNAESTYVHEYGHFIHWMAMHFSPDEAISGSLTAMFGASWLEARDTVATRRRLGFELDEDIEDLVSEMFRVELEANDDWELPEGVPFVQSRYGLSQPVEFIAESFVALIMKGKEDQINDAARRVVEKILPPERGMASRGKSTAGALSGKSVAEIADAVVPKNADEAREALIAHWRQLSSEDQKDYSDARIMRIINAALKEYFGDDATMENVFDFSWGTAQALRETIEASLSESGEFRRQVEKFGMPPVMATDNRLQKMWGSRTAGVLASSMADHLPMMLINPLEHDEYIARGPEGNERPKPGIIVRAFDAVFGLKGIDGTGERVIVDSRYEGTIAHEWGHYVAKLAMYTHPDPEVRALARFYFAESWKAASELDAPEGSRAAGHIANAMRHREIIKRGKKPDKDQPFVLTRYGQTSPAETFAEGLTAMVFKGDRKSRDLVSTELQKDIATVLGVEDRSLATPQEIPETRERGMASFSGVKRNQHGVRDLRNNAGPLRDGPSWLKDATSEEIADAVVPRNIHDAVVLTLQNILYGMEPQSADEVRKLKALVNMLMQVGGGKILFDFSPEAQTKMRNWVIRALDESPEFAWAVRQYGMPPIMLVKHSTRQEIDSQVPPVPFGTIYSEINNSQNILGVTVGNLYIAINGASQNAVRDVPSGFLPGGSMRQSSVSQITEDISSFMANMGLSVPDTIRHEWAHFFWNMFLGKPIMYQGEPRDPVKTMMDVTTGPIWTDISRDRRDRAAWFAEATGRDIRELLSIGDYLKDMFKPDRPYWSSKPEAFVPFIQKLAMGGFFKLNPDMSVSMISGSRFDTPEGAALIGGINNRMGYIIRGQDLWNPTDSEVFSVILQQLLGDTNQPTPSITGAYAHTNPQEMWAEMMAIFTSPDADLKSRYLSDEAIAAIGKVFGFEIRRNPAARRETPGRQATGELEIVNPPWDSGRGMASRSVSRNDALATLPRRTESVSDQLMSKRRIDSNNQEFSVQKGDAGNFIISVGSSMEPWQTPMGDRPRNAFSSAYASWASTSGSTNIRQASAEIMGMDKARRGLINDDYTHALAMLDDVNVSPTFSETPGYRVLYGVRGTDDILSLEVGESVDLPLTSFNPNDKVARGVPKMEQNGDKNVVLRLASGARVSYPEKDFSQSFHDRDNNVVSGPLETITQGSFKITGRLDAGNAVIVDIEHVETFDALDGTRKAVPKEATRGILPNRDGAKPEKRDFVPPGRRIGGMASRTPLRERAKDAGVSLDAFDSEEFDDDDVEWSTNDWSFSKTGPVEAGDAVVVREGPNGEQQILMISRAKGPFRDAMSLPGGLMDPGESPYDAADREMFEEVGISVGQAVTRKPLGEIEARDWDPRFVSGGRIGGVRYEVEPDVRVEAADDARGLQWVSVEDLSTGEYSIAFGHATWLAEAFRDDPVLGPRFAVLAEASRVRNQRIIAKIDERRRAAGVREFGDLPDPNQPYMTVGRGMASRSLIKPPAEREKRIRERYDADREDLVARSQEAVRIYEEKKDFADRLEATLKEFEETGVWNGAKNNVYINEGNAPIDLTAEEAAPKREAIIREATERVGALRRESRNAYSENDRIWREAELLEKRRDYALDRLEKNPETIDIEDVLADPELLAEVEQLAEEFSKMPVGDRRRAWTDEDGTDYVLHFGAADLEGGVLDPDKSRGVVYGEPGYQGSGGNTRDLNQRSAQFLYGKILDSVQRSKANIDVYREILSGRVNLDRSPDWWRGSTSYAEDVLDGMNLLGRGEIEVVDGQRFLVFGEDSQVMAWARDKVPGIISSREESLKDDERRLVPFEKVQQDNWQHLSSYPASELINAFDGYGGRYEGGDASDYDGQGAQAVSDVVGIHLLRSKLDDDSFTAGPGGDERALVGKRKPVFSISASRDRREDFARLFPGLVAKAIAEDRARRSGENSDIGADDTAPERGMASRSETDSYPPFSRLIKKMDREGDGWEDEDRRLQRLEDIENMFGWKTREAIEMWYTGADDVTYSIREEIESGEIGDIPRALIELVDYSPVSEKPLYRGMRLDEEALRSVTEEGEINFPLGATSSSITSALEYANDPGGAYDRGVLFEIRGAKAFPIHHFSPVDDSENLVRGRFRVVAIESYTPRYSNKSMPRLILEPITDAPQSSRTSRGKSLDWVDIRTKNFASNHPSMSIKSLSYTKPELRERLKRKIMAGDKGGKPGQWSARKAQLLAMEYRKAGGGYRGGLRKTQRSLKSWTRQKWRTSDGKPAIRKGGTRRYLPAEAWDRLTPAQRAATNRKKIAGSKKGRQFVSNTRAAERAGRNARN